MDVKFLHFFSFFSRLPKILRILRLDFTSVPSERVRLYTCRVEIDMWLIFKPTTHQFVIWTMSILGFRLFGVDLFLNDQIDNWCLFISGCFLCERLMRWSCNSTIPSDAESRPRRDGIVAFAATVVTVSRSGDIFRTKKILLKCKPLIILFINN